jgi:hypothetical protein
MLLLMDNREANQAALGICQGLLSYIAVHTPKTLSVVVVLAEN